MAAPALAASIDASAISSAETGRCGLMVGVWIDPVTAQVMITLRFRDAETLIVDFAILPSRTLFRHSVNQ